MSAERTEVMAAMYRDGKTLEQIGSHFGVSRERVRQIIRRAGVLVGEGGAKVRAEKRVAAKRRAVVNRAESLWGVPFELWRELRAAGVIRAFEQQRQAAKIRAVDWQLTFAEWYAIWQTSGKLHLRGRGIGKYVMARTGDEGPYAVGNVQIQLSTQNNRDAVKKWAGKTKAHTGVFCIYPGREKAWMAKVGKVSLGFYSSIAEATAAREAYLSVHPEKRGHGPAAGSGRGYQFRADCPLRPYRMQCTGMPSSYHATPEEAEAAYREAVAKKLAEKAAA
jgi:hypothetical protein